MDKTGKYVQIKSRRDSKGGTVNRGGTTGKFTSFKFDYALYTELDANFDVTGIYKLDKKAVRKFARPERNDVSVSKFHKYGEQVFPKKNTIR